MPDFNTNLRLFQMNSPINVAQDTEGYFNAGVNAYTGHFQSLTGNSTARAAVYDKNQLILAENSAKDMDFGNGYFLIGFWLQFAIQNFTTDDITIVLQFEDGSTSFTTLPVLTWTDSGYYVKKTWAPDSSTFYYRADNYPDFDSGSPTSLTPSGTLGYINWTTAHYITIVRETNGAITYRCDGTIFGVDNNTANFNLNSNSFMIMDAFGHENTIGNTPIIDDLIIANQDIQSISTTAPTDYLVSYSVSPGTIPWQPTIGNILKVY